MSARVIPARLRERLSKFVLLLGSPIAGERDAAAGALERTLRAEGFDFHDFVAAFQQAPPPPPRPPPSDNAEEPDQDTCAERGASLVRLVDEILARDRGTIDRRSREFLRSMRDRGYCFDTVWLSPKQLKWLTDLARKTGAMK